MIYLDTSFLVPIFFKKATSIAVESFIRGLPKGEPTLSHWTRVAFSSFLAKGGRLGGLSAQEAGAIDARFEAEIHNFTVLAVSTADFDIAKVRLADHRRGRPARRACRRTPASRCPHHDASPDPD